MRSALKRLLASPPALTTLRGVLQVGSCNGYPTGCACYQSHQSSARPREQKDGADTDFLEQLLVSEEHEAAGTIWPSPAVNRTFKTRSPYTASSEQRAAPRILQLSSSIQPQSSLDPSDKAIPLSTATEAKPRRKKERVVVIEDYEYESDFNSPAIKGTRLVDREENVTNWWLWLELVRYQKRHHGNTGAVIVFREIIKIGLELPTKRDGATRGETAKELWDRFFQAGHQDSAFLGESIEYAKKLVKTTGQAVPRFYGSVIIHQLIKDPKSSFNLHRRIKDYFPPTTQVYQKIFNLSFEHGTLADIRKIYRDHPLSGMYGTVIPELCSRRMYREATDWHHVLLDAGDLPKNFSEVKPLLTHYIQVKDDNRVEQLVKGLAAFPTGFESSMEDFHRQELITRETLSRELGQVHGIAPKRFSDKFCARLFATKLFSVELVISGLRTMGVESIGPLSLREIAARTDCNATAISNHIDQLREAGISLDRSLFSTMIRKLALGSQEKLLRSTITCDLHPDTFGDLSLQERLLVMYCESKDDLQMERTLAIMTAEVPEEKLDMQRQNLILRCYISVGDREKVLAMLERMKLAKTPLTPKTSRHLRVSLLAERRVGRKPADVQTLMLIVGAMKQTLTSGGFLPLTSWRELLKRLGTFGYLAQYQELALWLVDWYSGPALSTSCASSQSKRNGYGQLERRDVSDRPSLPQKITAQADEEPSQDEGLQDSPVSRNTNPQSYLLEIFGPDAQHAIIAWGFQQEEKRSPNLNISPRKRLLPDRPEWQWGLKLLKEMQNRGVPIHRQTIARCCKHRLDQLFGDGGSSDKPVNRRARALNDIRRENLVGYEYESYVKGMEKIWGNDLFGPGTGGLGRVTRRRSDAEEPKIWRMVEK